MIKQSITFEDFDGNTVTEDHYFHLSKSELIDMELSGQPMSTRLETIGKSGNGGQIIGLFKEIIAASYGQRVDGSGSQFYKTPAIAENFMQSLAFDAFLTTLLTDAQTAIQFVNGIMPRDLMASAEVQAALAAGNTTDVPLPGLDQVRGGDLASKVNAEIRRGLIRDAEKKLTKLTGEEHRLTGLQNPLDVDGSLLPWAWREPTQQELRTMNPQQMADVYGRKSGTWEARTEA